MNWTVLMKIWTFLMRKNQLHHAIGHPLLTYENRWVLASERLRHERKSTKGGLWVVVLIALVGDRKGSSQQWALIRCTFPPLRFLHGHPLSCRKTCWEVSGFDLIGIGADFAGATGAIAFAVKILQSLGRSPPWITGAMPAIMKNVYFLSNAEWI